MDKLSYAADTTARVPGANLILARRFLAATGNSTHGYFGGGGVVGDAGPLSTIDKITYSNDTRSTVPSLTLSVVRNSLAATGNSTHGYFGGGYDTGSNEVSRMDKVTYASDTTAVVPGAALSLSRRGIAASSARANGLPTNIPIPFPVIV